MTAPTKKTTTKKRPGKPRKRWTDEEIAKLREEVAAGPTARDGIKRFAEATNRSPATVQQKWYSDLRNPSTAKQSSGVAAVTVRDLDTTALVALMQECRAEVERRTQELRAALDAG